MPFENFTIKEHYKRLKIKGDTFVFVVAIDGPAGTGKSTIAKLAAEHLNMVYVDTGAIYRALAFVVMKQNVDPKLEKDVLNACDDFKTTLDFDKGCLKIFYQDKELNRELRHEKISTLSSIVSSYKTVRQRLLNIQRDIAIKAKCGAVFEGRDMGTVVFPKSAIKLFFTADQKTRAQRRFAELKSKKMDGNFDDILAAIIERDRRDEGRINSPLQMADDAILIDTSNDSKDSVLKKTLDLIQEAKKNYVEEMPW